AGDVERVERAGQLLAGLRAGLEGPGASSARAALANRARARPSPTMRCVFTATISLSSTGRDQRTRRRPPATAARVGPGVPSAPGPALPSRAGLLREATARRRAAGAAASQRGTTQAGAPAQRRSYLTEQPRAAVSALAGVSPLRVASTASSRY